MSHLLANRPSPLLAIDRYVLWELEGDPVRESISSRAHPVTRELLQALDHYRRPASRLADDVDARFSELAETWREATAFLSSATHMAMHPAYQQIIGMGRDALPFILRELKREPDHWFWALRAITGVDPVPVESRGRIDEMAAAWHRWARDEGLRW